MKILILSNTQTLTSISVPRTLILSMFLVDCNSFIGYIRKLWISSGGGTHIKTQWNNRCVEIDFSVILKL